MAKKKRKTQPAAASAKSMPRAAPTGGPLLWAALPLAMGLRLIYLKLSQSTPFYEPLLLDARYYHEWALRVARGDLGNGVFYGLPLYPFFLGCVYKLFHESLLMAKLTQLLLGVVTVYFIYRIGEKIADKKIAAFSALVAACYGPMIFHEGIFIPEALGVPLYAATFFMTLVFLESPTRKKGVLLGIFFGLCLLTKAGILIFILIFLGGYLWKFPQKRAAAIYCFLAFCLTLAPVTAHNVFRGKDFVWLTSHSGFNFYVGNNEHAEGVFTPPKGTGTNVDAQIADSKAVAEQALGRELKDSEVSRYWSDRAWKFIRENPAKFFGLCLKKLFLFFDSREISDIEDYQFAGLFNPFLRIPWPNFSLVGPLFFLGLTMGYKRLRHRAVLLVWIGGYIAGMMVFFVNARYRLPLLPVMIPVAVTGAAQIYADFMEWRLKRLVVSGGVLLAGIGLTQLHWIGADFSRDYVNAGDAWVMKEDPARALPLYEKALELKPDSPKATLAMGLALTKLGRTEEAKDYYFECLQLEPGNSQAHNNLGLWYDQRGEMNEAERHFLEAIRLKPNSPQAHNNLGMVYGKRGERAKASQEFEESIRLNPSNSRTYTNLGLIHYQMGDKEKARSLWEKALAINPRFEEARRALELLNRE
jgi:Tfp pilus assembly protein PilF/4-amino-4-deoxy-L-arabinose transferase-like glycosyltransferase